MQFLGVFSYSGLRASEGASLPLDLLQDTIIFTASLWCFAHACFKETYISNMQGEWTPLLNSWLFYFLLGFYFFCFGGCLSKPSCIFNLFSIIIFLVPSNQWFQVNYINFPDNQAV